MQAFGTSTASVYYSPASAYAHTRGAVCSPASAYAHTRRAVCSPANAYAQTRRAVCSPANACAQTRGVRSRIFKVPLAKRGNRTPTRFPPREAREPNPHTVPLAKRGEPEGGGQHKSYLCDW